MKNIVLASTSPRRQELMENVGLLFDIVSPDFDENILNKSFSYELIEDIAQKKGESVAVKCNFPALVVSADTVVIFNNIVLGKPKDFDDAYKILKHQRRKPFRHLAQFLGLCCLVTLSGFQSFPVLQHLSGSLSCNVSEHMGMTIDQFLHDSI